jgi:hypothetical protein
MSDNENKTKPKYEAPTVVPLVGLARGVGECTSNGSAETGTCTSVGGSALVTCTNGVSAGATCTSNGSAATVTCTTVGSSGF